MKTTVERIIILCCIPAAALFPAAACAKAEGSRLAGLLPLRFRRRRRRPAGFRETGDSRHRRRCLHLPEGQFPEHPVLPGRRDLYSVLS